MKGQTDKQFYIDYLEIGLAFQYKNDSAYYLAREVVDNDTNCSCWVLGKTERPPRDSTPVKALENLEQCASASDLVDTMVEQAPLEQWELAWC
jgi:hypothetical protein